MNRIIANNNRSTVMVTSHPVRRAFTAFTSEGSADRDEHHKETSGAVGSRWRLDSELPSSVNDAATS